MRIKDRLPELRFKDFHDEWNREKVGVYYYFKNGLNKGKEYFGHGTPIINFTDVFHNRGLKAEDIKGSVEVTKDEIKNYNVEKGDIFFTRTSETIDEIGYPSVMLEALKDSVFSGFVLRARSIEKDPLELRFKQYAFFTEFFRSEMIKKSSMTTRALTSGTSIKKMFFTFPKSQKEQSKIGKLLANLDNLISLHRIKHEKLSNLKKAMLQRMFPKEGSDVPQVRFKRYNKKWEKKSFLDIVSRISKLSSESSLPRVEYEDIISGRGELNKNLYAKNNLKTGIQFNSGDILFGKLRPYLRNWLLPDFDGIAVGDFWVLRTDVHNIRFVFYLIQTFEFEKIANQSSGSKMPRADWNLVSNSSFRIPNNVNEQEAIGKYFTKIDNLLLMHQKQINKFDNVKRAMLDKLFV